MVTSTLYSDCEGYCALFDDYMSWLNVKKEEDWEVGYYGELIILLFKDKVRLI